MVEVEILLQTDMNGINNGWDSTKRAETPYFHCGPSSQNENGMVNEKKKHENKYFKMIKFRGD